MLGDRQSYESEVAVKNLLKELAIFEDKTYFEKSINGHICRNIFAH